MSKPKYKQGKQIRSISEFEVCESLYYKVRFGSNIQTKHRAFLISWQYRTLLEFIKRGDIYIADRVEDF